MANWAPYFSWRSFQAQGYEYWTLGDPLSPSTLPDWPSSPSALSLIFLHACSLRLLASLDHELRSRQEHIFVRRVDAWQPVWALSICSWLCICASLHSVVTLTAQLNLSARRPPIPFPFLLFSLPPFSISPSNTQ